MAEGESWVWGRAGEGRRSKGMGLTFMFGAGE